jgi:acyl phosphate:glycerol-3-phosphate acyltransferase
MTATDWLWVAAAFISGSLPFSLWVGRLGLRRDIRAYGDGNPGTFNVMRAGGLAWGGLALVLDISKAAVPVGLASQIFDIQGLPLVLIALAPPLGHAFSPFLRFRGGKAIAATAGTLIGLTQWIVFLVGIVLLVLWYNLLTSSGWAVMFTAVGVLAFLLLTNAADTLLAVWIGIMLLMIVKHRAELMQRPVFKVPSFLRPQPKPVEPDRDPGGPVRNGGPDRH